jgi:hypothetical protein
MSPATPVLDYSRYVEVVGREANAAAYGYFPSEADLASTSSRLLSSFHRHRISSPPSLTSGRVGRVRLADPELSEAFAYRVGLFDAIEAFAIPFDELSVHRALTDWMGAKCYICSRSTSIVRTEEKQGEGRLVRVRACPSCGWWESENLAFLDVEPPRLIDYDSYTLLRRAVLREFAIVDEAAPLEAIRHHLHKHGADLNHLSPRQLERLVGTVFADFFDCEAVHVGGPGDGGLDLILLQSDCDAVVQVKQHTDPKKSEPVSTIRDFLGAMFLDERRVGLIVTTANAFSRQAREAVSKANNTLVERLDIVHGQRFLDILRATTVDKCPALVHGPTLDDPVPDFSSYDEPKLFGV